MNKSQRVTALTVLRDAIDAELENARAALHAELLELQEAYQVKSIEVSIDSTIVANATLSARQNAVITSKREFQAYVEEHYPHMVETVVQVNPDWQKQFLAGLEQVFTDGKVEPVDSETGLFVDGVTFPPAKSILTVRFKAEGREKVAELFRTGQATLEELMSDTPELTA